MSLKKLAAGVALTTLATLAANAAWAQSTASQVAEVVVTTSRAQSAGGVALQTQVAKDQAIITTQYIQTQIGSSNATQLINLLPGVTYSTEDPTGLLSSDLRVHGFDGARVAITIDGTPVNDTGNYASYPGEYIPAEVTDRIAVNVGGAEVDAPTASSLGATVNIVSKLPQTTPGFQGSVSGGSYDYLRGYGEIDTGEIGPWGTRAYFTGNYVNSDKYKGEGNLNRLGADGKIYQPIGADDFVSLAYTYVKERSYFYESSSPSQFSQYGSSIDYNTQWGPPTAIAGHADGVGPVAPITTPSAPGFEQGNDANFWATHPNPVDFADVRIQSKWALPHNFTFTFDPSFFYTLANGGGTTSLSEKDARLIGNQAAKACPQGGSGVDLNGDGDCLDTVLVYSPSNTQTDRFGILSSLLWDPDAHNHFQFSYTLDYGNHRQTGAYGLINQQTGFPQTFFGGYDGTQVLSQDGTPLRSRDRFSIAELNQFAFNYIGKWMDDKLHVNVGVRDPYFTRHINQYCYTYNGGSAYCDSVSLAAVQNAYNLDATNDGTAATQAKVAAGTLPAQSNLTTLLGTTINYNRATGLPNFRFPFTGTFNFNKVLPNGGATYNFNDANQVYVSYSQGFAAPKTDDLYVTEQQLVQPETSDNFAGGYRYTSPTFTFAGSLWGAIWHNHIVQSIDPQDPSQSIDRNVGEVSLYGLDAQVGIHPIPPLQIFASFTLEHSQLDDNYFVAPSSGPDALVALPVKGKELVMTPDQQFSLRGQYTIGPVKLGIQGKYVGSRFADDVNSYRMPGYTTVDLDATYELPHTGGHATFSINANNITYSQSYVRVSTNGTYTQLHIGADTVNASSGPFFYLSAPTTVYAKLAVKW
jgi:iron complex outermembrane recepter protein